MHAIMQCIVILLIYNEAKCAINEAVVCRTIRIKMIIIKLIWHHLIKLSVHDHDGVTLV